MCILWCSIFVNFVCIQCECFSCLSTTKSVYVKSHDFSVCFNTHTKTHATAQRKFEKLTHLFFIDTHYHGVKWARHFQTYIHRSIIFPLLLTHFHVSLREFFALQNCGKRKMHLLWSFIKIVFYFFLLLSVESRMTMAYGFCFLKNDCLGNERNDLFHLYIPFVISLRSKVKQNKIQTSIIWNHRLMNCSNVPSQFSWLVHDFTFKSIAFFVFYNISAPVDAQATIQ